MSTMEIEPVAPVPGEPIMPDQVPTDTPLSLAKLNKLAYEANQVKKMKKLRDEDEELYPEDVVNGYVTDIEKYVLLFAEDGHYQVEYDCAQLSKTLIIQICEAFKAKHNYLFVLQDLAKREIVVDWSGQSSF